MSAHPHGNIIVLLYWDTKALATWIQYPTQSHYPNPVLTIPYHILLTSPCPIRLMLDARLGSDKYQFHKLLGSTVLRTLCLLHRKPLLYQFGHRVWCMHVEVSVYPLCHGVCMGV